VEKEKKGRIKEDEIRSLHEEERAKNYAGTHLLPPRQRKEGKRRLKRRDNPIKSKREREELIETQARNERHLSLNPDSHKPRTKKKENVGRIPVPQARSRKKTLYGARRFLGAERTRGRKRSLGGSETSDTHY